jgi:ketosteroid isomerase-like protein
MSTNPDLELLHRTWEALGREDLAALDDALAPEAEWRGVLDDARGCEGRGEIVEMIGRRLGGDLRGTIEETTQVGSRTIVAFRPERPRDDGRPLQDGVAYVVVTLRDGKIVEIQGCVDRAAAAAYARTGACPRPQGRHRADGHEGQDEMRDGRGTLRW